MTNISKLCLDLVEKILSKVPITSIGAVRSTCKLWNSLSKDRILCKAEVRRHQFLRFMVKNYKLCSMRFDLHGILDQEKFVDPSIKEIIIGDSLNHVKVTKVFHCHGLLLCVTKDKDKETEEDIIRLVVWNPYLGQTRWIQPRIYYDKLDVYALGYDNKNRKHKILRFFDHFNVLTYEIYDISLDSWRVLDITPDWDVDFYHRGVSLKGNTYFFAKEKLVVEEEGGPEELEVPNAFLFCFDFTRERFGPPLPLPFHHLIEDTGTLSSLRDEQLAALYQCLSMPEVEIWVTTKIEPIAVSWAPFLRIDMGPLTDFEFQFHFDGASFFIDEDKKVAVVFHIDRPEMPCYDQAGYDQAAYDQAAYDTAYLIGENGYFEKVGLGEGVNPPDSVPLGEYCLLVCSCSYVPSLVHINNQFAGGKN